MQLRDVQSILLHAGYYKGTVDGEWGRLSSSAADHVIAEDKDTEVKAATQHWPFDRRAIAAAQILLNRGDFHAGAVDGLPGNATNGALLEWQHVVLAGDKPKIPQILQPTAPLVKAAFPFQKDCPTFYGTPGQDVERQLDYFNLPIPLRLDWDLDTQITRMRLHRKAIPTAKQAYEEAVKHYGEEMFRELGLDRYAGSYFNRPMRGGKSPSMHAFGAAIDSYAEPNGLTTKCPKALFCAEEYVAWFNIWEALGWVSLGRAIGRDWMHVQAARL